MKYRVLAILALWGLMLTADGPYLPPVLKWNPALGQTDAQGFLRIEGFIQTWSIRHD